MLVGLDFPVSLWIWQKQQIHRLQVQIRCLWVKTVHDKGGNEIEDGKDDVGFVANVLKCRWRNFDNLEVDIRLEIVSDLG
jgi:hypothetical protein